MEMNEKEYESEKKRVVSGTHTQRLNKRMNSYGSEYVRKIKRERERVRANMRKKMKPI